MKNFLKFVKKNRVILSLLSIIIVCLIICLVFGFRIFWGETSINNEKLAISAVNAEKKFKYHLLTVEDFYSKSNILKLCRIKVLEINF